MNSEDEDKSEFGRMKALKISQIMEKMIAFSGKSFEKSGRGASGKPYPFGYRTHIRSHENGTFRIMINALKTEV